MNQFNWIAGLILIYVVEFSDHRCPNVSTNGSPVLNYFVNPEHSASPGVFLIQNATKTANITCKGKTGKNGFAPTEIYFSVRGPTTKPTTTPTTSPTTYCNGNTEECNATYRLTPGTFKVYSYLVVGCQVTSGSNKCTYREIQFNVVDVLPTPSVPSIPDNPHSSSRRSGNDNILTIASVSIGVLAFLFVSALVMRFVYRQKERTGGHEDRSHSSYGDVSKHNNISEVAEKKENHDENSKQATTVEVSEEMLEGHSDSIRIAVNNDDNKLDVGVNKEKYDAISKQATTVGIVT